MTACKRNNKAARPWGTYGGLGGDVGTTYNLGPTEGLVVLRAAAEGHEARHLCKYTQNKDMLKNTKHHERYVTPDEREREAIALNLKKMHTFHKLLT